MQTASAGELDVPREDRRRARALAAWIGDEDLERLRAGAGGKSREELDAALRGRPSGLDQAGLVAAWPAELDGHAAALRASEAGQAMFANGWELALITDAHRLVAAQPTVFVDDAPDEVEWAGGDLASVARLTLPLSAPATEIPAQLDEARQAWRITSRNPNVRITGTFGGEVSPGVLGFGFLLSALPSFVSVADCEGRYVLCDGYHRLHRLIGAGVVSVPAFVRSFAIDEAPLRSGVLGAEVYMSERPPTLGDYHDDGVAEDLLVAAGETTVYVYAAPASLATGRVI